MRYLIVDLDVGLSKVLFLKMWIINTFGYLVLDLDLLEGFAVCPLDVVRGNFSHYAIQIHIALHTIDSLDICCCAKYTLEYDLLITEHLYKPLPPYSMVEEDRVFIK